MAVIKKTKVVDILTYSLVKIAAVSKEGNVTSGNIYLVLGR